MSKYPAFERVTARKLAVGDRLLVRDRQDDRLVIGGSYPDYVRLEPGTYEVLDITSRLEPGWSGSTRYYDIVLAIETGPNTVSVSSVTRLNRVKP